MSNLEIALKYASLDFKVFPCGIFSKVPLIPNGNGVYDATKDKDLITEWWTKYPDSNIALAIPEDKIVVDVDGKNQIEDSLTKTVTAITPRINGGKHYWYKKPIVYQLEKIQDQVSKIDILTYGSYVLAPPSLHPNGGKYKWINAPTHQDFADIPTSIVEFINNYTKKKSLSSYSNQVDSASILSGVSEGKRNIELFRLACSLRARNIRFEEALAILDTAAKTAIPPYKERSVIGILERVYERYPAGESVPKNHKVAIRLDELLSRERNDPVWVIEKILPEGFCLFTSDPKLGKSMIVANLSLSICRGDLALGHLKTNKSSVLYLDLEQGESLAINRWEKILCNSLPPNTLYTEFIWDRMDVGGFEDLVNFLNIHEDVKLIIIDVLACMWPIKDMASGTAYQKDYAIIRKLSQLARDYHISIIGVHHNSKERKDDFLKQASGSMGMTAASDVIWALNRSRDSELATIDITGKNVMNNKLNLITPNGGFNWYII